MQTEGNHARIAALLDEIAGGADEGDNARAAPALHDAADSHGHAEPVTARKAQEINPH